MFYLFSLSYLTLTLLPSRPVGPKARHQKLLLPSRPVGSQAKPQKRLLFTRSVGPKA